MVNVKVINNIKTKLFPIGHFLNTKKKQFLTPKLPKIVDFRLSLIINSWRSKPIETIFNV